MLPFPMVKTIKEWNRHNEDEFLNHYISNVYFYCSISFHFLRNIMCVRFCSYLECHLELDLAYSVLSYKFRFEMRLIH